MVTFYEITLYINMVIRLYGSLYLECLNFFVFQGLGATSRYMKALQTEENGALMINCL